jgi:GntR family transcriptional regulator of arabinose operon
MIGPYRKFSKENHMPLDLSRIQSKLSSPAVGPLYQRLRLAIQAQILDGTLQPGDSLPPERELQKLLDLSRSTVRQAIRSLADAGMLRSRVGAGNFVLKMRPAAVNGGLIGMIASEMNFYLYYAQVYASFSLRMREAGFRVDMSTCDQNLEKLYEIASDLIELGASGVAINPPPNRDITPVIDLLKQHEIPVVIVGRHNYLTEVDYVGADHAGLGYSATRYLLQMGHTKIAYFGPVSHSSAAERAGGYVRAMHEANLSPRLFWTETGSEPPPVHPSLAAYFQPGDQQKAGWAEIAARRFTAAFCFNDETASMAQREMLTLGLDIPGDLSIISIDNLPFLRMFHVPPTTFSLPGEEVGEVAAGLLLRRLAGELFPPQRILIPGRFVQRLSTAPLHVSVSAA